MQESQMNICPNCGAVMQQHSFTYECDYCGTIVLKDGLSEIYYEDELDKNVEDKYNYLSKNYSYISQGKNISCIIKDNIYEIKTIIPFYANDGKYNKIEDFNFTLFYDNDKETEHLYLCVLANEFSSNPQLSILIDMEICVRPIFDKIAEENMYFKITRKELQIICEAHTVQVASNFFASDNALFNELPAFSSRFYHYTFDKRKYIYSLHKNLISDN